MSLGFFGKSKSQENITIENKTTEIKTELEKMQALQEEFEMLNNLLETKKQELHKFSPIVEQKNDFKIRSPRDLLHGIRTYDGTSDVEAFLRQVRIAKDQLSTQGEKDFLLQMVIASKLKGDAQVLVERYNVDSLLLLGETLRTHFGIQERSYSQLIQERCFLKQKANETVESYIRRFSELDRKIQISIDNLKETHRNVIRDMEIENSLEKFLDGLHRDVRVEVKLKKPKNLKSAYLEAQIEEKKKLDEEILHKRFSRQEITPRQRDNKFIRTSQNSQFANMQKSNSERKLFCKYCKKEGHTEDRCYIKNNVKKEENFRFSPQNNKDPPMRKYLEEEDEGAPVHPTDRPYDDQFESHDVRDSIKWEPTDTGSSIYASVEQNDSANCWSIQEPAFLQ